MPRLYFDDIQTGQVFRPGEFHVDGAEMLAFNRKWDTLPVHVDEAAAMRMGHRGIIASGQYTLCIKQYFVNRTDWHESVIGTAGWDDVKFRRPVYAGDTISAEIRCVDRRASGSKPDRGIVKFEVQLSNQHGDVVLSYIDTVVLKRRHDD